MRIQPSVLIALALLTGPVIGRAQDVNIVQPIPLIEQRLAADSFRILDWRGSRMANDRTQRVTMAFQDSSVIIAKWAVLPRGGEAFNNSARHEVAAYEIQTLFLEPQDYVVPPTVIRSFDLEWYRTLVQDVEPTFNRTSTVLVALQYWLSNVTADSVFNLPRFDRDTAYARHLGNLNLLTYLIKHNDANAGNVLVSSVAVNPRLFAVDNGLSFDNQESNRGTEWRELRVPRVPAYTIEKLRTVTRADLDRVLGVLAEFELREGRLHPVEPGENLNARQGIRRRDNRVQFGLTSMEIRGVEDRLANLLRRVDQGRVKTF